MARIRAALILVMLLAVALSYYFANDLKHLDVSSIIDDLLEKTANAILGNEYVQAVYHQMQAKITVVAAIAIEIIEKASHGLKILLTAAIAAVSNETKIIVAMLAPYLPIAEKFWQMQNSQTQTVLVFIIASVVILSFYKARFHFIFLGEDWSKYSSESDIKIKCIEPLIKNWKFNYVSERPCKFRQGHKTHEGKIDFYLYDDNGPITIIEDIATMENDEDLRNARAQTRSYCLGLYIFENIVVNSFVIASKEGLKIYKIKHNEDHLVEEVSSDKLNRSRKRWIKEKLLEIR